MRILAILAVLMLAGCTYKSVTIKIEQDTRQDAGGSNIGGSSTGATADNLDAALSKMGDVLQPADLKQIRKIIDRLPDYLKQGALQALVGGEVPSDPVLDVPNLPFDPADNE